MKALAVAVLLFVGSAEFGWAQGTQPPVYWYYCDSAHAYSPYVKTCPEPWRAVLPHSNPYGQGRQPPAPAQSPNSSAAGRPATAAMKPKKAPLVVDETSPAFLQGQRDRQDFDAWYGGLSGDYLAGATYWTAHRSLPNPGSCAARPPGSSDAWTTGCQAAQQRLAGADVRRKTEPDYRSGWNHPPAAAPPAVASNEAPPATVAQTGPAPSSQVAGAEAPSVPVQQGQSENEPPDVVPGRCHMDECVWSRFVEREIVRSDSSGTLIRTKTITGSSKHPNGSYDVGTPIEWGAPSDEYIFCSKTRPAVIFDVNNQWIAHLLAPGYSEGVFGYNTDSYIDYFFICHGLKNVDLGDASLAQKFSYAPSLVKNVDQLSLRAPQDIMQAAAPAPIPAQTQVKTSAGPSNTMPPSEEAIIQAVAAAIRVYDTGENDMQKGASRPSRARAICAAVPDRYARDWLGIVEKLSTNSEGKGVLYVSIAPGVHVKTWNNALSDTFDNTLIDPESGIFQAASRLKEGQKVRFSGAFPNSDVDCIRESSMTLSGSIREPEFIMRFQSISPIE